MTSIDQSGVTASQVATHPPVASTVTQYQWDYGKETFAVTYETSGHGDPVLLLPALSTVSTRQEMAGIAQVLSSHFQVFSLDWLGFGDSDRPAFPYDRSFYCQFLEEFVRDRFDQPIAIIAAGHSAGYAMHLASTHPSACSQLMLIAPTWKGPLKAMGAPVGLATGIRNVVRSPLLGQVLYFLNTRPPFLKWMYQRHVYADVNHLTPELMQTKYAITQQPGARLASAGFVTAALDPMADRDEWLRVGQALTQPTCMVIPKQAPPQSTAEMESLAALPGIHAHSLPGSLGLHEEYAETVGAIALTFLQTELEPS